MDNECVLREMLRLYALFFLPLTLAFGVYSLRKKDVSYAKYGLIQGLVAAASIVLGSGIGRMVNAILYHGANVSSSIMLLVYGLVALLPIIFLSLYLGWKDLKNSYAQTRKLWVNVLHKKVESEESEMLLFAGFIFIAVFVTSDLITC